MKDKLKNRVDKTRQSWDLYETDLDALWNNIEEGLNVVETSKRHKESRIVWMKIAAAVVVTFGISWFVFSMFGNMSTVNEGYALRDVSPELAETELYYATQISEKLEMIQISNADVDNLVFENLALLDSAYDELKLDLKDNVDNEEVVGAMIENYRIKLEILEQILYGINKDDNKNNKTDAVNI